MKWAKIVFLLLIAISTDCSFAHAEHYAGHERSQAAKNNFKLQHPCPSNGGNHGPCPGYIVDHIKPLACSGDDAPSNMQWQSVEEGKAKDKWERKDCQISGLGQNSYSSRSSSPSSSSSKEYNRGPRGGCFVYTSGGKKRYVNRSNCQ